jgi:hypothetical protein
MEASESAELNWATVNAPKVAALPEEVMCPVKFALVVTFPAVKPDAVPVTLVITPLVGVPNNGTVNVLVPVNVCVPANVATVASIAISSALAVIPVPPITFKVTSPVTPPPVNPDPATTEVTSPASCVCESTYALMLC